MPTPRDYVVIDPAHLICMEPYCVMSHAELGALFQELNRRYLCGDYAWVAALPFVRKVYPARSKLYRRHIPAHIRRDVLSSGPCVKCKATQNLTVDHIVPVSKGGSDQRSNLQPMCSFCNISKSNRRSE
jgi:hypothetical protein